MLLLRWHRCVLSHEPGLPLRNSFVNRLYRSIFSKMVFWTLFLLIIVCHCARVSQAIPIRHNPGEVERVFVAHGKDRGLSFKSIAEGSSLDEVIRCIQLTAMAVFLFSVMAIQTSVFMTAIFVEWHWGWSVSCWCGCCCFLAWMLVRGFGHTKPTCMVLSGSLRERERGRKLHLNCIDDLSREKDVLLLVFFTSPSSTPWSLSRP